MGRHRGELPAVVAMVNGVRVRWQQAAEYGEPGVFTGPDSVVSSIREAVERKQSTPMRGILVTADDTSAVGVMAAMEIASRLGIRYVSYPKEVEDWFAENRPEVKPVDESSMVLPPESGLGDKVSKLLKRRLW